MSDADLMRKAKPGEIIKHGATVFVVSEVVDGHVWGRLTSPIPGECCRICGMMRRADKSNKPCNGPITDLLRQFFKEIAMRELVSHKVNVLNKALTIEVLDEPGQGNFCRLYKIYGPMATFPDPCCITFQNGPIHECGVNGVSQEALLAIVEDRLTCSQSGPYACRENEVALTKIQEAMMWLQKRTLDRMHRGVEETSKI